MGEWTPRDTGEGVLWASGGSLGLRGLATTVAVGPDGVCASSGRRDRTARVAPPFRRRRDAVAICGGGVSPSTLHQVAADRCHLIAPVGRGAEVGRDGCKVRNLRVGIELCSAREHE